MKIFNKLIIVILIISLFIPVKSVFASGTTGTIDNSYKHAWSENLGWINFGSNEGNVQVTDSALSGYAWGENTGWINLDPSNSGVQNDVDGNLSGYAWGENTGWINFDPTNGGVTIDQDGEFLGYAWGENTGWINFNCSNNDTCSTVDYKIKTDWVPLSCGNGLVEGGEECDDGNTDSGDGCDSSCANESGGGGPPQTNPPQVSLEDEKQSSLLINNGDEYTNSTRVSLSVLAYGAIQMAISNSSDFSGISWETYRTEPSWILPDGDGIKNVFIKFRSEQGGESEVVSDSIILNTTNPENPIITNPEDNQVLDENTFSISGTAESNTTVIITLDDFVVYQSISDNNGSWSYLLDTPLRDGRHYIHIQAKDGSGLLSDVVELNFIINTKGIDVSDFEDQADDRAIWPFGIEDSEDDNVLDTQKTDRESDNPYDLISEELKSKLTETLKRMPDHIRILPVLPELSLLEEVSQSVFDNFLIPVVSSSVKLAKGIVKTVFVEIPKFVFKEIANSYRLVKYQANRLIVLLSPPEYEDIVELLPPIKKSESQLQKVNGTKSKDIEKDKLFFSSVYGNINLDYSKEEKFSLLAGSSIKSYIKPSNNKEIKEVKGRLMFRKNSQGNLPKKFRFLKTVDAAVINKAQAKDWLVSEFFFTDNNNDSVYESNVQIPPVAGEYFFKVVVDYKKDQSKEIEVEMLIDPEGYIYTKTEVNKEIVEARLSNAKITLFWLNPVSYEWQVWSAYSYDQKNPQITNKTGQYSFLTPEGMYYLKVEKEGYGIYTSEYFEVKEGSGIHKNIELKLP